MESRQQFAIFATLMRQYLRHFVLTISKLCDICDIFSTKKIYACARAYPICRSIFLSYIIFYNNVENVENVANTRITTVFSFDIKKHNVVNVAKNQISTLSAHSFGVK